MMAIKLEDISQEKPDQQLESQLVPILQAPALKPHATSASQGTRGNSRYCHRKEKDHVPLSGFHGFFPFWILSWSLSLLRRLFQRAAHPQPQAQRTTQSQSRAQRTPVSKGEASQYTKLASLTGRAGFYLLIVPTLLLLPLAFILLAQPEEVLGWWYKSSGRDLGTYCSGSPLCRWYQEQAACEGADVVTIAKGNLVTRTEALCLAQALATTLDSQSLWWQPLVHRTWGVQWRTSGRAIWALYERGERVSLSYVYNKAKLLSQIGLTILNDHYSLVSRSKTFRGRKEGQQRDARLSFADTVCPNGQTPVDLESVARPLTCLATSLTSLPPPPIFVSRRVLWRYLAMSREDACRMEDALMGCLGRLLPSEHVQRLLEEEVAGEEGVRKAQRIRSSDAVYLEDRPRADAPACNANLTLNCTLRRVAWGYLGRSGVDFTAGAFWAQDAASLAGSFSELRAPLLLEVTRKRMAECPGPVNRTEVRVGPTPKEVDAYKAWKRFQKEREAAQKQEWLKRPVPGSQQEARHAKQAPEAEQVRHVEQERETEHHSGEPGDPLGSKGSRDVLEPSASTSSSRGGRQPGRLRRVGHRSLLETSPRPHRAFIESLKGGSQRLTGGSQNVKRGSQKLKGGSQGSKASRKAAVRAAAPEQPRSRQRRWDQRARHRGRVSEEKWGHATTPAPPPEHPKRRATRRGMHGRRGRNTGRAGDVQSDKRGAEAPAPSPATAPSSTPATAPERASSAPAERQRAGGGPRIRARRGRRATRVIRCFQYQAAELFLLSQASGLIHVYPSVESKFIQAQAAARGAHLAFAPQPCTDVSRFCAPFGRTSALVEVDRPPTPQHAGGAPAGSDSSSTSGSSGSSDSTERSDTASAHMPLPPPPPLWASSLQASFVASQGVPPGESGASTDSDRAMEPPPTQDVSVTVQEGDVTVKEDSRTVQEDGVAAFKQGKVQGTVGGTIAGNVGEREGGFPDTLGVPGRRLAESQGGTLQHKNLPTKLSTKRLTTLPTSLPTSVRTDSHRRGNRQGEISSGTSRGKPQRRAVTSETQRQPSPLQQQQPPQLPLQRLHFSLRSAFSLTFWGVLRQGRPVERSPLSESKEKPFRGLGLYPPQEPAFTLWPGALARSPETLPQFVVQRSILDSPPEVPFHKSILSRHLIVDERLKAIYCFIPKVACTSWKLWFRRQRGIPPGPNQTAEILATHNMHTSQLDYLGYTYGEPQAIRALTDPSLFRFTFVRNPYARLVSVYLNKHVQGGFPFNRIYWNQLFFSGFKGEVRRRAANASGLLSLYNFTQILARMQQRHPHLLEGHVRPQSGVCQLHRLQYDFVGRMESLEEGVRHVLERLGTHTGGEAFELGKSAHPTGADSQLRSMYTQEVYDMVKEIYGTDMHVPLNNVYYQPPRVLSSAYEHTQGELPPPKGLAWIPRQVAGLLSLDALLPGLFRTRQG